MFRYTFIINRELQSCTLLKLRSFFIIKISLKIITLNIYVIDKIWFLKYSLYQ